MSDKPDDERYEKAERRLERFIVGLAPEEIEAFNELMARLEETHAEREYAQARLHDFIGRRSKKTLKAVRQLGQLGAQAETFRDPPTGNLRPLDP